MFSYEFCHISKNTFFTEHLRTAAPIHCDIHKVFIFTFIFSKFGRVEHLLKVTVEKCRDISPSFMCSRIVVLDLLYQSLETWPKTNSLCKAQQDEAYGLHLV